MNLTSATIITIGSSVSTIPFWTVIAFSVALPLCVGIIGLTLYGIAKCISNCNIKIHDPNQLVVHC